jgi:hypothetical protein
MVPESWPEIICRKSTQFRANHHNEIMKNRFIRVISADAIVSMILDTVREMHINHLIINSSPAQLQSQVVIFGNFEHRKRICWIRLRISLEMQKRNLIRKGRPSLEISFKSCASSFRTFRLFPIAMRADAQNIHSMHAISFERSIDILVFNLSKHHFNFLRGVLSSKASASRSSDCSVRSSIKLKAMASLTFSTQSPLVKAPVIFQASLTRS